MAIFNKYNTLSWYGETENSNAEYNYVVREQLPDFPVTAFDECDVRPLVERAEANVVVHCSCGHREELDDLPYDYKFLFVSKMTDSKGDMHFTVHVSASYKCQTCTIKEFRDRMDPCFDRMLWAHGLSAYSRTHTVEGALARLRTTLDNPEWEVCISEKDAEIGPYGVYLKGHLTGLFDGDVWSSVDQTGHRTSEEAGEYEFVGDSVEKYLDKKYDDYGCHRYFEGFLTQYRCEGIWMKRSASHKYADLRDALRKEARHLGVPFWLI